VVSSLADIEEVVSKPFENLKGKLKGKKVWIIGGVGLAVVVFLFKGFGGGSSEEPAADVIGGDQSIDALGSQLQTLAQSMGEFQTSVTSNQASIVEQLVELQTEQTNVATKTESPIYQQPVMAAVIAPVVPVVTVAKKSTLSTSKATSGDGTYTGTSSSGYINTGITPDVVLNTRGEYMFTNVTTEQREEFIAVNGTKPGGGSGSSKSSSSKSNSSSSGEKASSSSGTTKEYSNDGSRYTVKDSSGNKVGTYDSKSGKGLAGTK